MRRSSAIIALQVNNNFWLNHDNLSCINAPLPAACQERGYLVGSLLQGQFECAIFVRKLAKNNSVLKPLIKLIQFDRQKMKVGNFP